MALAGTLNEPLDHRAEGSVLQRHDRQSGARADIAGSPACVPGAIIQSVDAYVIKTSPIAMIPSDRISARTPPRFSNASAKPVLAATADGIWHGRVGADPRKRTTPIQNSWPSRS